MSSNPPASTQKEVTNEEAEEFLKLIKQSEYDVVRQLNRTPCRISIMKLLMDSEKYRNVLMEVLNKVYVPPDINVNNLKGIVNSIKTTRLLTFTNEDIPSEGRGPNRPLYISMECKCRTIARVLIDNGSSLNVMPKTTLECLPDEGSTVKQSEMMMKAFDGTCRGVIREVELPVKIDPSIFNVTFYVMDIPTSYCYLLGRPWIHCVGAMPSTLHHEIKFAMEDEFITMKDKNDIFVTKLVSTPYIEAVKESSESTFRAFETVNIYHVEGIPKLSASSVIVSKFIKRDGFDPKQGLGRFNQGIKQPIVL